MSKLNKVDIVDRIAPSAQDRPNIERIMMSAFAAIRDAMAEGHEVSIHGFGQFQPVQMSERQVRNPRTGETMTSPAKVKARFKPAKALADALKT